MRQITNKRNKMTRVKQLVFSAALISLAWATPSLANTQTVSEQINVNGKGAVTAIPDKLTVNLYIEEHNLSVSKAKQIVDAKSKRLINSILQLGINEQQVQSYQLSIQPHYETLPDHKREQDGFMVSRTFKIQLNNWDKFDTLIDKSLGLGVTRVGQISTLISNRYDLYLQALEKAVEQAKVKAAILAKQAGRDLGAVIQISEQGGYQHYVAESMSFKSSSSNSLPGTAEIQASVSVSFKLD
ncbi:SIMPL domain-containing protein [Catenovulum adriaticum]|uniref:SIMPL domain-containing protein n=1 Tax=Catenovulum adriaticum TaxID=2984846 RepID=A0ABY7AI09_9ALTE|nr:SIMPL domain-containing protein [Catenovulum sp. TS8]WAJ69247.1 SIMPL domain-containing protein [Catenovulum sp. TS8]